MIQQSFAEAIKSMQAFVLDHARLSGIFWVFSEDMIYLPNQVVINSASIDNNENIARTFFNLGVERDFGLAINAFCQVDGRAGCTIQLPEDDVDAQYKLMANTGVKYSIREPLLAAKLESSFVWKLRSVFSDTVSANLEITSKKHLQFPVD